MKTVVKINDLFLFMFFLAYDILSESTFLGKILSDKKAFLF